MSNTRKVYLFTLFVSTLAACSSQGGNLHEDHINGRRGTGRPALHAIYDDKLRVLMEKMDTLTQDRFMTQTELDQERHKYAQGIAGIAGDLRQTVTRVIERMPALQLSDNEQQTFLALAQKLSEQSGQLQEQAQLNRIDALDDLIHQINMTCNSCHTLFRNFPHK
ncbi:MAG: hypothetical protein ACXWF8_14460 [Methylobacter sp.]